MSQGVCVTMYILGAFAAVYIITAVCAVTAGDVVNSQLAGLRAMRCVCFVFWQLAEDNACVLATKLGLTPQASRFEQRKKKPVPIIIQSSLGAFFSERHWTRL